MSILSRPVHTSHTSESASDSAVDSRPNDSRKVLSDEIFQRIFQTAADAIVITDGQGQIVRVNAHTEALFGYAAEDLIGHPIEILVPQRSRQAHTQNRTRYIAQPRHRAMGVAVDVVGLRSDGSEIPLEISLNPVSTESETLVVANIRDVSERQVTEKMRQELAFETTLSKLSAVFINLSPERVDGEIIKGLRLLGDAMNADRGSLGEMDESGTLVVSHSWARPGFPPFPERIITNTMPWLEQQILRGEVSFCERPEDLPPEAGRERAYMQSLGLKSSLVMPFHIGGKVTGVLSSGSFRNYQTWNADIIARFRMAAEIFANALARKTADSEIRKLREQLIRENIYLQKEIELEHSHSAIIGNSLAIRTVLKKIEQVAATPSVVLVLGETGTGKELVARTIHNLSQCKGHPMVKVNCAALPGSLIESELFGREKGAFTGALAQEVGRFELANGSTIFLDEIGELPLEVQPKLLRVLQEGEFERLGSPRTMHVAVRVIAATSRDLDAMIKEGKFREDLYYRLNVFPISVPPLRERLDDMALLVRHILNDLGPRMGRKIEGIRASTLQAFQNYHWPGNIRELRNVIERNLILHDGLYFQADLSDLGPSKSPHGRLRVLEEEHIREILRLTNWRIRGEKGAAKILGLKPTTLEARMKKLGIQRPI
ncbi:MAG TPA: sigma 54-interacting transcriptional regulator [Verrucomicrobiae bacterium]|nr:sigma 54-interacting transcriptional regulator [Verrucomicrobiae bacterium]